MDVEADSSPALPSAPVRLWPSDDDGRRESSWGFWLLAVVLAALWHLAWGLLLQPASEEITERVPRFPLVSYIPFQPTLPSQDARDADVRVLWSPHLFSLSSPVGFSQSVMSDEIGVRPPLAMPLRTHFYVDRTSAAATGSAIRMVRTLPDAALNVLTGLVLTTPQAPVFPSARGGRHALSIAWTGGLEGAQFENLDTTRPLLLEGEQAWETTVYVEFNRHGVLTHAVMDPPTPYKGINRFILRKLSEIRLLEPGEGRRGCVVLRYAGAAPRPLAQGGAP
ncbi:MAG TPA: hypothetical protein DCZ95_04315 [Verrucomicrobia bacterium]|nr:MAG: hypothetical protein A2X46_07725 [Lentisphaerae bacterium GWF2_57_35]HBA83300.1 hypothetical protein [Verrucomicrobiota bacterium]